jgi:transcriptional regulator with XRE-family HTH domain
MSGRQGLGTLGELLRGHRFAAGLSQRALSERAGISVRTLPYLEQGQIRRPHAESVRRLAAALDLPDAARARLLEVAGTKYAVTRSTGPSKRADRRLRGAARPHRAHLALTGRAPLEAPGC